MSTRPGVLRALLVAATVIAAAWLAAALLLLNGSGGHERTRSARSAPALDSTSGFAGAALPAPVSAPGFTLRDEAGHAVSLASYRGRVTVLAFLSAACGGPCVLIADQIRGALDELGRPVGVLLVSLDPGADTPRRARRFLAQTALAGRAHYLSGPARVLRRIWGGYRVDPAAAGIEGAAIVLLLDRAGRERVLFGLEQLTPEGLAHDLRKLGA